MDCALKILLFSSTFALVVARCSSAIPVIMKEYASENQLLDALTHPSVYDKRSRPPSRNESEPLLVSTSIDVSVIGGLDTPSTEFTSQLLLRYKWIDSRLRYQELAPQFELLDGEDWIQRHIWTPTVYINNEKQSSKIVMPKENVYISIQPDGLVSYEYRLNLCMYCSMDIRKFPFDTQICKLHLESWSLKATDLLLTWDSTVEEPVTINPEFPLLEYSLERVGVASNIARRRNGNYSGLFVAFTLSREVGHYILDFYVPAIFLVMISWVSFWLDPSAIPGRVTLGSSTLLTFITLTKNLSSSTPKVSYIKAVDIYSIMCTAFIFLSLLEFAFVNGISRRRKNIELKKLNTHHVLKSTLTPSLSRRTSSSKLNGNVNTGCNGSTGSNETKFTSVDNQSFIDHSSQNELTVTSLDGFTNRLRPTPSNGHLSVSMTNLTKPEGNYLVPTNSETNLTDSCASLTIQVPQLPPTPTTRSLPGRDSNSTQERGNKPKKPKKVKTPQEIAIWLDRRSRYVFPLAFILANILYWNFIWL